MIFSSTHQTKLGYYMSILWISRALNLLVVLPSEYLPDLSCTFDADSRF